MRGGHDDVWFVKIGLTHLAMPECLQFIYFVDGILTMSFRHRKLVFQGKIDADSNATDGSENKGRENNEKHIYCLIDL